MTINDLSENKDYFISTKDKGDFLVYASEGYKFSEIDLINLIKICHIEERSKTLGKRLLEIYRDSTKEREEITNSRLKILGIEEKGNPTRRKKIKSR